MSPFASLVRVVISTFCWFENKGNIEIINSSFCISRMWLPTRSFFDFAQCGRGSHDTKPTLSRVHSLVISKHDKNNLHTTPCHNQWCMHYSQGHSPVSLSDWERDLPGSPQGKHSCPIDYHTQQLHYKGAGPAAEHSCSISVFTRLPWKIGKWMSRCMHELQGFCKMEQCWDVTATNFQYKHACKLCHHQVHNNEVLL